MSRYVFISYCRADRAYVDRLAEYLAIEGVAVWYDYEIATGERFSAVIQHQIDMCAAFVVVLSSAAVASEWVNDEIDYALNESKSVLPMLLESCKVPIRLGRLHREDVTGGQMPGERFMRQLCGFLAATEPAAEPPQVSGKRETRLQAQVLTELAYIPKNNAVLAQQVLRMIYNNVRLHDLSRDPSTSPGKTLFRAIKSTQENSPGFEPRYDQSFFRLEPP